MSAEIVVPKRRGRPPKKAAAAAAVAAADQDNAIVIEAAATVPKRRRTKANAVSSSAEAISSSSAAAPASKRTTKKNAAVVVPGSGDNTVLSPEAVKTTTSSAATTKRRGAAKSGSSSSSSVATSTSTSTSSASAPAPAQAVDAEVGDKQVADNKAQKAAAVSHAASSPSQPTMEAVELEGASGSAAKLKTKSRTRKPATATVVEGSAGSAGPSASASAAGSASASTSASTSPAQSAPLRSSNVKSDGAGAGNARAVAAQADASDASGSQKPGLLATSKILQQAKAFAETSRDLHDSVARLVEEREAVRQTVLQQQGQQAQQVDVGENVQARRPTLDEVAAKTTEKDLEEPATQISSNESVSDAGITSTTQTIDPVLASQATTPNHLPSTFVPLGSTSTTTSTPAFGFPKSKPKVQVVVPKYIIPNSTVAALAARNVHSQRSSAPGSSSQGPSLPPSSAARRFQQQQQQQQGQGGFGSSGESGRPRPTQIPLDQLKKDPEFRALSRRWTSLMVALPFAIVTSYFLWQRYEEHQAYLKSREAKRTLDSVSWKTAGSDDASPASTSTSTSTSTSNTSRP
ncbi:hypothetical protein ABEF95_009406 [Exophiala dermatitidis]